MTEILAPAVTSAVEQLAAGWWRPVTDNERQSLAGQKRELGINLTVYLAHRLIRGLRPDAAELVAAGEVVRPMLRGLTGPARLVVGHTTYPAITAAVAKVLEAQAAAPPECQPPRPQ